ncbi:MAG: hypothetical protein ACTHZZ_04340 [Halomonas sp.]|uniref:hypothetical protein n=1 Tax=Halomonas sp. AOP42-B2-16 TaxID=3457673 RepID=UPI003FB7FC7C
MNDTTVERASIESGAINQYRLSWLAYIRPLLMFVVMLFVSFLFGAIHVAVVYGGIAFSLAVLVYQIMVVRSVVMYTDDEGVWVYSGVLPWSKGRGGVRWRDVEDARFYPGFVGWVLKAYTVRVGHRFTRSHEIALRHVRKGDQAVEHINELHGEYLRNGGGQ